MRYKKKLKKRISQLQWLLPQLSGLVLFSLTLALWWTTTERDQNTILERTQTKAAESISDIETDLVSKFSLSRRLARRWTMREETPTAEIQDEIKQCMTDLPGLQMVLRVNALNQPEWAIPNAQKKQIIAILSSLGARYPEDLLKARAQHAMLISSPITLNNQHQGFINYVPLFSRQSYDGSLVEVIDAPTWLNPLLLNKKYGENKDIDYFKITVFMDKVMIYQQPGDAIDDSSHLTAHNQVQLFGHVFSVKIQATPALMVSSHSLIPELTLIIGSCLSVLIATIIFLLQKTFEQTKKLALSEKKYINQATLLATEKEKLANIIIGTNIGTWEWNVQTGEMIFNERWASIIGYTLKELTPLSIKTWEEFCHPDELKLTKSLLNDHFNHKTSNYDCEVKIKHKNGNWIWVHDRGKVATWTEDGKPLLMFGTRQDITQRKFMEEQIYHQANFDLLTGLPSRRLAEDRLCFFLVAAARNQQLIAIMFLDLDGFKPINDTYGHHTGDLLLKEVAIRLTQSIRKSDTVARIGGDEFLIILPNLKTKTSATQIAKKILHQLSQPFNLFTEEVSIGASIGISISPDHGQDAPTLIKIADQAMYAAKRQGTNLICLAPP